MKRNDGLFDRIKIGSGIALLVALTGCVGGYVDVGGGYEGVVVEPVFGVGVYDRGHDARGYSHRGAASRAVVHSRGGGGRR